MDGIDDDPDDYLGRLPPMTDSEKVEVLLCHFAAIIHDMSTPTLRAFRAHCAAKTPRGPDDETMLEVIDGELALREINA